ncbi:DUF4145 domain-containing protein [Streptomyces sp. NPDC096176]|uniref:DUF4145 domain-containing protein n=1 Tax=Streptomyces sp. NPDC096176 TaxID=3366079 RepID=UPI0038206849
MPNLLIKDLRVISRGFSNDVKEWPNIPCPTCGRGNLTPAADTFVYEEAEMSKQAQYDPESGWEPDWSYGGFHCILRCGRSTCDLVRVVGNMSVVEDLDERGRWYGKWLVRLTPTFFHPSLPLVQSHEAAPRPVLQRLEAGAAVVWVDPSSAANRLRSAAEALLDDQGIPRRGHSSKGPYDIKLHQRIENFKKAKPEYSDAADALLATKWIGNVGSHEDALKISDVLDGAEMIDFALMEIYDTSREAVKKMAAEITARKGVPARKFQGAVSPGGEVSLFGQQSG